MTKGQAVGQDIRRLGKNQGSEAYDAILEYYEKHGAEGGAVSGAYDRIGSLKMRRVQCGGMSYYISTLEDDFDTLEDEGEKISEKFKREALIKGVTAPEFENLRVDMRTHPEWDYEEFVEKFHLLAAACEAKLGKGQPMGELNIR